MAKSRSAVLDSFRKVLAKPVDMDSVLAKAGQKDRANVTKHLAALNSDHSALWKRLTQGMATLAPLAITTVGQQAVQFFIADGKYRMQVFAIEDLQDGQILLFIPDVLAEAIKLKILAADDSVADRYEIVGAKDEALVIEALSGPGAPNPSPHYKNMLGWNRKALKVVLPIAAPAIQIETAEALASLASRAWADKKETA